jgi:hypothetical protein
MHTFPYTINRGVTLAMKLTVVRQSLMVTDCTTYDTIYRPVFYLKHVVSETGFFLRSQAVSTQLGPIDEARPCLGAGLETRTNSVDWPQLSRYHLKTTESSLRKAVLNKRQDDG